MPFCNACGALVASVACPHCTGAIGATALLPESTSRLPAALRDRFNFGACFFGIVWLFYNAEVNQRWIALGALVVGGITTGFFVPIGYQIWLGFHANRLAAEYGRFPSVAAFEESQRAWTRWAIVAASVLAALGLTAALALAVMVTAAIAAGHTL
jgi:hypothetical protein